MPTAGDTRLRIAQNEAAPSLSRVGYSEDQADRGHRAYTRSCVLCHGDNLDDGEFGGRPLRGLRFEQTFGGEPASALFLYISTLMPPDRPGRLSPGTYADITAYILKRNGYKTGTALPSDVDALDKLIVER